MAVLGTPRVGTQVSATSAASISVPYPASITVADTLFLAIGSPGTSALPTTPAGYSLIQYELASGVLQWVAWKRANGTESGSLVVTLPGTTGVTFRGTITAVSGVRLGTSVNPYTASSFNGGGPGDNFGDSPGHSYFNNPSSGLVGLMWATTNGSPSFFSENVTFPTMTAATVELAANSQLITYFTGTGSTGTYAASFDTTTIVTCALVTIDLVEDQGPSTATNISPAPSASIDRTAINTFTASTDALVKFQIRHRTTTALGTPGTGAWTTEALITTTTAAYPLAANTLSATFHEWQASYQDLNGIAAASWSTSTYLTAVTPPAGPTINSPTAGTTFTTFNTTLNFTAGTHTLYETRLTGDTAGVANTSQVFYDSGSVTSATSTTNANIPFSANRITAHIQVRVFNSVWSGWSDVLIHINYVPTITTPIVIAAPVPDSKLALLYTEDPGGGNRVWLDRMSGGPAGGPCRISGLQWTTTYPGGDTTFSATLSAPPDLNHVGVRAGRRVVISKGAAIRFQGTLDEPQRGEPWQLSGPGLAALSTEFAAVEASGNALNLNAVIDAAIARGLPWTRPASLTSVGVAASGSLTLDSALAQNGQAQGTVWSLDTYGALTVAAPPTTPDYVLDATQALNPKLTGWTQAVGVYQAVGDPAQTTTSSFIASGSAITAIPVSALPSVVFAGPVTITDITTGVSQAFSTPGAASGATSIPVTSQVPSHSFAFGSSVTTTNTGVVTATNAAAQAKFGHREGIYDLTNLGALVAADATTYLTAWLAQNLATPTYSNSVTVQPGQLHTPGGAAVDLATVRAGCLVTMFDVDPSHDQLLTPGPLNVLIGQTTYDADSGTLQMTPVGADPNDFLSIIYQALGGAT